MVDARKFLSDSDREAVEARIAELEKASEAEVVCAVATESGRYDRAESLVGILCAVAALFIGHSVISAQDVAGLDWSEHGTLSVGLQVTLVVVGFAVGSIGASYLHAVRRLFCSKGEMHEEVDRAASYVFSENRLQSTRKGGGILIYLSLFERQIRILADTGAVEAVPQEKLEELVQVALPHLKKKANREAFVSVLDAVEPPLADAFPPGEIQDNELENTVLTIHPRP